MPLYCATVYYKDGALADVGYDATLDQLFRRLWSLPTPHYYVVFHWGRVVATGNVAALNDKPVKSQISLHNLVNQNE